MSLMLSRRGTEVGNLTSLCTPLWVQKCTSYAQSLQTSTYVHNGLQVINDKEICVDSKWCKGDGTAMLSFDTPRFREARPEHIQNMPQEATEDVEAEPSSKTGCRWTASQVKSGINDKEICVDSKLCKGDGTAMLSLDTPRFREARPEHIQKMLQEATEDGEAEPSSKTGCRWTASQAKAVRFSARSS